ncbi:MAG: SusC/RagA family TonB-linked outer membrane protein [Bernardetiaceae bacterium]
MKKRFGLSLILGLLISFSAWAQKTISGTVTDDAGEPLPGVSVQVKGTLTGTQTDFEGKYTIKIAGGQTVLVFRFVGMASKEVEIGDMTTIDVTMSENIKRTDEVVITALGFEEDRDRSASSSSNVGGVELVQSGEPGLINSMAGKLSGINIVQASGDPGAGSRIQIRGASTITGDLQPLIVVDGVPMFNDNISGAGSNYVGSGGGVTQQSRLNDINPNDIESMEVLKGASAAALWGARAANGVIIITTKKGRAGRKSFSVNVRSSLSLDRINKEVDLQTVGGQGLNQLFNRTSPFSWGDRIADRPGGADQVISDPNAPGYAGYFDANNGQRYFAIPNGTPDNMNGGKNSRQIYNPHEDLFKTGVTWNNAVSVSGGDEKGSFYVSFSDLDQDGIIKTNSTFRRTTGRANLSRYLSDKVTLNSNMGYTRTTSDRIQMGSNLSGLFLGGLRNAPDFDMSGYEGTYVNAQGLAFANRQRAYRNPLGANVNSIYDNPLWMMENIRSTTEVDRFIGKLELVVDPTPWLNIIGRVGADVYADLRKDFFPPLSAGSSQGGVFTEQTITQRQVNADLIARASFDLTSDLSFVGMLGANYNHRGFKQHNATARNFINPLSPPQLGNAESLNQLAGNSEQTIRSVGYFGSTDFAFRDMVFVKLTGRYDIWSTFGRDAQSGFFYPSAEVAWQFTQVLPESDAFSFGKLRASFGQVGTAPDPYLTRTNFIVYGTAGNDGGWGGAVDAGAYGGGFYQSPDAGNNTIAPERKTEFEIGTDLRFLKDRISFSATYYQNEIQDAILPVAIAGSSGFTSQVRNAATMKNQGLEIELSADVLKLGDFTWNLYGNWTRNVNEVTNLAGTNALFLGGFTDGGSYAVVGEQLGVLFGSKWERNDDGSLALDEFGFPFQAAEEGVIGDPNPTFRSGVGSLFSYKGLSLNVLFDMSVGMDMWNGTRGALAYFGRSGDTGTFTTLSSDQANSLRTWFGATVAEEYPYTQNADGSYTVRGRIDNFGGGDVFVDQWWYVAGPGSGFTGPTENFIEDATWVRLRELTLSYTLNSQAFRDKTKLQSASISFTGRNLALWTNYTGIDPDSNLAGAGGPSNGFGLDYFQNPATRSFIFTLSLTY